MRILLSSHGASPFGAERVLLALAAGLRERGHDVTLEIPHDGPALAAARQLERVRVWHSWRPRLPRSAWEGVRYLAGGVRAVARLSARIRRDRYELVWANSLFNPLAVAAARLAGVPCVWHIHERNWRGPLAPIGRALVGNGSATAVAVSGFVARTFAGEDGGSGPAVLHNAELRGLAPLPPPATEPFVFGYVGQLEPRKRVPDLLAALGRLPDDVRLIVVGDGKRRGAVAREIDTRGLAGRVEMVGFQEDLARWLAPMSCVVLPSRDEPFSLVALEAMASGRAVIAADHGAHREVLGDAALYYPVGDIGTLADRVERLRRDGTLPTELRANGLARAARFTRQRWLDGAERIASATARGEP
ncbi:MAG: glycosyltransferase [Longimicrobiales bacterium]